MRHIQVELPAAGEFESGNMRCEESQSNIYFCDASMTLVNNHRCISLDIRISREPHKLTTQIVVNLTHRILDYKMIETTIN